MYQIGEVAKLARVTVRQLHHYDEIGLLAPSARSEAGYRLYTDADLERLQQILFYRALEFPLEEIARIMNDPDFDRQGALLQQRELLAARAQQLAALLDLIDKTITEARLPKERRTMNNKTMFEVFPDMKPEYLEEAEQRWGDTDAWQQSARQAANYTKADWEKMKQEMEAVQVGLENVFTAGYSPDSRKAIEAVEAARLLIQRWHYDCSRQFHASLTAMTSNDERFIKNIDRKCPGLAAFIHEAAKANLALNG